VAAMGPILAISSCLRQVMEGWIRQMMRAMKDTRPRSSVRRFMTEMYHKRKGCKIGAFGGGGNRPFGSMHDGIYTHFNR
jgi:hypothetical protein